MNAPSPWLTSHGHLLPSVGDALDVACGRGRHALWLAQRGLRTTAVDRDADLIAALNADASRLHLPLQTDVVDLESGSFQFTRGTYDVIVVVHYLHRPLFPSLLGALRPGGLLVYETFTRPQALRGHPRNPAFLLEPGELVMRVQPLDVLASREGDYEGRMVASVIARRRPIDSRPL